jgi:hypothetical protein
MPATILALALVLLPSAARADSSLPWFGGQAAGAVMISETTGSLGEANSGAQLKINATYHSLGKICPNPRNFAKASRDAATSPQ